MSNDIVDTLMGAKVRFGLVQQGHIKIIEDMPDNHRPWNEINQSIGWAGSAANDSYIRYLRKSITAEEAKNIKLSKQIAELKREVYSLNAELTEVSM